MTFRVPCDATSDSLEDEKKKKKTQPQNKIQNIDVLLLLDLYNLGGMCTRVYFLVYMGI